MFSVAVSVPMLLGSLLTLASSMGHLPEVQACFEANSQYGVRVCLQRVLTFMMGKGIPLLLSVGRNEWDRVHEQKTNATKAFKNGSPMLLVDKDCPECSLIALVQPMGEVTVLDEGEVGRVPTVLRDLAPESSTALEMMACITAVPPLHGWFKQNIPGFDFNWDVSRPCQNATTYTPTNAIMNRMFHRPDLPLARLDACLGDYGAKLAALTECPDSDKPKLPRGRPKANSVEARDKMLSESDGMWLQWRRALLLESVLTRGDTYGVAYAVLGNVLPPRMFGNAPKLFTADKVCELNLAGLAELGDMEVMAIMQLTSGLKSEHAQLVHRPGKGVKRPPRSRGPAKRKRAASSGYDTEETADCNDTDEDAEEYNSS